VKGGKDFGGFFRKKKIALRQKDNSAGPAIPAFYHCPLEGSTFSGYIFPGIPIPL